jgi:hypothetical protein
MQYAINFYQEIQGGLHLLHVGEEEKIDGA